MSLLDNLVAESGKSIAAPKNRVSILLDDLQGTEDHSVLVKALRDNTMTNAVLTRALRAEYGDDVVKPGSVREFRVNLLRTVDGL